MLATSAPDGRLSDFLFGAVRALDATSDANALANFHLWFLRALATLTGIAPDFGSWSPGAVFDMAEGLFRSTPPVHGRYLLPADALGVRLLGRLTPANVGRAATRRRLLDGTLDYFALHGALSGSGARSLDILKSLF